VGKRESLNKAREIYKNVIEEISNDKSKWKSFLDFSSKFYKYSFTENLLMFGQNKNITMCATLEEWNSIGRWIKPKSTGLKILRDMDNEVVLDYVFDVSDTYVRKDILNAYTNEKLQIFKWKANEKQVIEVLNNHFNSANIDKLEMIVANYMATALDESELLLNLTDIEEQIVLQPEFLEFMIKNTTYLVAKRCGIKSEDIEGVFSKYSLFANPVALNIIGNCINYCSSELLKIIEYKIKEIKKEELKNGKIRKIWDNSKEEFEGVISNKIQRINDRGDFNGQTIREGTGNSETKGNNRETIKREESSTKNKRIYRYSKIQSIDRKYGRRFVARDVNRKNLDDSIKEVEQSTSFVFPKKEDSKESGENKQLNFDSLISISYQEDEVLQSNENIKRDDNEDKINKINYVIEDKQENETRTARERVKDNVSAINLLKEIENQSRLATIEEQKVLAKYSGWGGLSKAFDKKFVDWKEEQIQVREILSEREYEDAQASVLNAFYTNSDVVDSMYLALERMGFKGGNILEPSARYR